MDDRAHLKMPVSVDHYSMWCDVIIGIFIKLRCEGRNILLLPRTPWCSTNLVVVVVVVVVVAGIRCFGSIITARQHS